jgi:PII-like signaling protein
MQTIPITLARVYSREKEHRLQKLLKILHDEDRVMGATIVRGVQGFSLDGIMHDASLLDLSLDLPLILEFFDTPERVEAILNRLEERIDLHGVVCLNATLRR